MALAQLIENLRGGLPSLRVCKHSVVCWRNVLTQPAFNGFIALLKSP